MNSIRCFIGRIGDAIVRWANPAQKEKSLLTENMILVFLQQKLCFSPEVARIFFAIADQKHVLSYLSYVGSVDDECRQVIIKRDDEQLTQKLLDEKLWVPFPYGTTLSMSRHDVQVIAEA